MSLGIAETTVGEREARHRPFHSSAAYRGEPPSAGEVANEQCCNPASPSAGEERDRLWQRWVAADPRLDAYAVQRSTDTPVIVLEPRNGTA
jgi:hypothetical protein